MTNNDDIFDGVPEDISQLETQVLVVDDVPSTRLVLKDMLEQIGFSRIAEAKDGKDALQKLQKDRAQLIICDHKMDRMTGLELLHLIKQYPYLVDIPFIVLSSHKEPQLIDGAHHLGAAAYVTKPIDYEVLKKTIMEVLHRKFSGTPAP